MNDNKYFEIERHCGYDKNNQSIWITIQIDWPRELLDIKYLRSDKQSRYSDEYGYHEITVIHGTTEQRVKDIINEWARIHGIKASDDPHKYMYTQIDDKKFYKTKSNEEGDTYEFAVLSMYVD